MSTTGHPERAPLSATTLCAAILPASHLYTSLEVVEQTGSTNADLLARARTGAVSGAVRVAEEQTAGRGRLDRTWQSQPGAALTFSVLLRPAGVPAASRGWLPLLTGVAVANALREAAGVQASLKWPNDVLGLPDADGRAGKLAGILAEQAGDAIVVGIGLNVSTERVELPSEQATSLRLEGASGLSRDAILIAILRELEYWYLRWARGSEPGDAESAGLRAAYLAACSTIGREIRVELPGGAAITGRAVDVDGLGRLLVSAVDGEHAVSAGDVVHVRPTP
jgi:BirA family biotin operon repressor/biotin-[acetyl-CoA-carboxylase] ligase